jgi:hypothetical protein
MAENKTLTTEITKFTESKVSDFILDCPLDNQSKANAFDYLKELTA